MDEAQELFGAQITERLIRGGRADDKGKPFKIAFSDFPSYKQVANEFKLMPDWKEGLKTLPDPRDDEVIP